MLFAKSAYYSKNVAVGLVLFMLACSGRGNVDLSKATKLTAEPVNAPKAPNIPMDPLFNNAPGSSVSVKSLGTIDQTGLSLVNDYDGDGIPNNNSNDPAQNRELNGGSNQWVADYPIIEASVVPPVTMKIQILKNGSTATDEIVSQINSDDYEEVKEKGTEKVHQNELNTRSTMIQDEYSEAKGISVNTETSSSADIKAGISVMGFSLGGGGSSSQSRTASWSNKTGYSSTKTTFPTVDFKNNLDRDAVNLKSDAAARNSRKYRIDRTEKKKDEDRIEPNAGVVRVALYIKNLSANMPVRLTNILSTFMFEANDGKLIPVQSFRLRNEDYSLFSVNIYGGSEFGPYVIELPNLNTAEIERALQLGFNPKVFIVDYDMTHVPNSNYKNILTSYQGDNLKIVEENTKGRTALLKIKGPQMREMYRVAAFSISDESPTDDCVANGPEVAACPGISMRKALERVRDAAQVRGQWYYATNVEYQDYIFDFSDELPKMKSTSNGDQSKVYLRTVKTLGNISNRIQCEDITQPTGSPSTVAASLNINNIPVCKAKPFNQLTDAERQQFGVWVVFANGKFYTHSEYEQNADGSLKKYRYNTQGNDSSCPGGCDALVARGIDGTVWVGDNFDWVFLTLEQFLSLKRRFGNNPLETGEVLSFNTKWDLGDTNTNIFDPQFNSKYLGQAVLGDRLEIIVNLQNTKFLNPKFRVDDTNGNLLVQSFSYYPANIDKKFSFNEAIDFEINLGVGDQAADWGNISQPGASKNSYYADGNGNGIKNCGKNLDYLSQQFRICVELPTSLINANSDGRVNVYLRPILHNAYRNIVWPKNQTEVNKFQGELANSYIHPANTIDLAQVSGEASVSDRLIISENSYSCEYVIAGITGDPISRTARLTLENSPTCTGLAAPPSTTTHSAGLTVGVKATDLTSSEIYFSVSQNLTLVPETTTNYFHDFNAIYATQGPQRLLTSNDLPSSADCANNSEPLRFGPTCFGIPPALDDTYAYLSTNWVGGADIKRNFNDARWLREGNYLTTLINGFYPRLNSTSRWEIAPLGSNFNGNAANKILVQQGISGLSNAKSFLFNNKILYVWQELGDFNGITAPKYIRAKITKIDTGEILLDSGTPLHTFTREQDPTTLAPVSGWEVLPWSVSEQGGKVAIAFGNTWEIKVNSNVPGQPEFGLPKHKSEIGLSTISIDSATVVAEIPVGSVAEAWVRSLAVSRLEGSGDAKLFYTTNAYVWKDYNETPVSGGYYVCPPNTYDFPQGWYGTINHVNLNNGTCVAQVRACSMLVFPGTEYCVENSWSVPAASYVPYAYETRSHTVGVDSIISRYVSNDIAGPERTAPLSATKGIHSVVETADRENLILWIKEVQTGLITHATTASVLSTGNIDPTLLSTPVEFYMNPEDTVLFGISGALAVGLTPNALTSGTAGIYFDAKRAANKFDLVALAPIPGGCATSHKCVAVQKFAPKAANVLWLEEGASNTLKGTELRLSTDSSQQNHLISKGSYLVDSDSSLSLPSFVLGNERLMLVAFSKGNKIYAQPVFKELPPIGTDITAKVLYTPTSNFGTTWLSSLALPGYLTMQEIDSGTGNSNFSFLHIKPSTTFAPKYGLNNFFAAPLIERNYTATAKVLIK